MQGRRLGDREFSRRLSRASAPMIAGGDYGRVERAGEGWVWMCCTPNGLIGDLSLHTVVEHDDKTITVSPSILSQGGKHVFVDGDDAELYESRGLVGEWHGYLTAGVWSEC
jgi:hypothetical protein